MLAILEGKVVISVCHEHHGPPFFVCDTLSSEWTVACPELGGEDCIVCKQRLRYYVVEREPGEKI